MATVLPRMLSFLLTPLYTSQLPAGEYGKLTIIFSSFVLLNVILSYGMETTFFRFFSKEANKEKVVSTVAISLLVSTIIILLIVVYLSPSIASMLDTQVVYLYYIIGILFFDTMVIVPYAWLRANERPIRYSIIKIGSVVVNFGLNVLFLVHLKSFATDFAIAESIYKEHYEINYVLISNTIASMMTCIALGYFYVKINYTFDRQLWRKMMQYSIPVLIAGIAFSINEVFDRFLLGYLLPKDTAAHAIGVYSACYKLALFMTLFATAFRLGIEPFFFNHATAKNATTTYAQITKYFVIFGTCIFVIVITFIDILKISILRSEEYWEALMIVPIILLANFCLGIYHNLSVWYKITDRTRFGAYISITGAVITLLLNFWLIPMYTYVGAAIATLGAYGTMMLLSWYFGRKYYPIPYDLKKISMYLLFAISFTIVSFYMFESNYIISIPLLLGFLVVLYVTEKSTIKQILKK